MPELVSSEDAAVLLEQVRLGQRSLEEVPGYPIFAVELGDVPTGTHRSLAPATGWPVVVVGVVRSGSALPAVTGPDVLLTDLPDPAQPWVSPSDGIDRALADFEAAVHGHPQACTTLVQVLRATEKSSVGDALVTESLAYAALQGGGEHRRWLEHRRRPSPDGDPAPCVQLEREGSTLRIALNRPTRRNAYSSRMRDELIEALEVGAADGSIELIEVRGNGPNFCSGGDLAEFGTVSDTATAHWIRMQRSVGWWIHHLKQKSVVHVHGACVGAGVELPAFAGSVVAAPDATFALPEVGMGLIPGAGGTASIPRRIGRHRTAWLALTGNALPAQQALEWGLVDRLQDGGN